MKRFSALILFCVVSVAAFAQPKVEYYRWTKTYHKNGNVENISGNKGQFVARNAKVCYDCDKEGCTVYNGTLTLVNREGSNSKYEGESYFGKVCTYTFYDAKGVLNIKDMQGNVHVFRCESAPAGKSTCSLIKKRESSGSTYTGGTTVIYSGGSTSSGSSSYKSSGTTTQPAKRETPKQKCRLCKGSGVCHECHGMGKQSYSISAPTAYSTCKSCHGNRRCRSCNGSGHYDW